MISTLKTNKTARQEITKSIVWFSAFTGKGNQETATSGRPAAYSNKQEKPDTDIAL